VSSETRMMFGASGWGSQPQRPHSRTLETNKLMRFIVVTARRFQVANPTVYSR
jgi:hypothetical protein